jgi:hypothetical protein
MSRVVVTGGAGKAGRAVVRDLGYEPAFSWRDAIGRST